MDTIDKNYGFSVDEIHKYQSEFKRRLTLIHKLLLNAPYDDDMEYKINYANGLNGDLIQFSVFGEDCSDIVRIDIYNAKETFSTYHHNIKKVIETVREIERLTKHYIKINNKKLKQ